MREYEVYYLDEAKRDLRDIFNYIHVKSQLILNAERFVKRITVFCDNLNHFPHRGTLKPEFGQNVRSIGFENRVLILFRVNEEEVEIMRILYGGRDY